MVKKLVKAVHIFITILGCIAIYLYIDENNFVNKFISYYNKEHSSIINNEYGINTENNYFKKMNEFVPKNRDDLLNIYYTVLKSSNKTFTFYCHQNYNNCVSDIKSITNDSSLLSHMNNFVHPYNTYKSIKTSYSNYGKVTISITKLYSDDKIKLINDKIDEIYPSIVSSNKSTTENIRKIHDYIINNVKYDETYESGNSIYEANTAYGTLFQGYAVCSGYTDLMAIFLYKMGISNYKISNDQHVWNSVYLDGKWFNLDLTWDDPIYANGKGPILYDYFLITNEKMAQLDIQKNTNAHTYNKNIYTK